MAFRKYNFCKKFLDFLTGFVAFLTVAAILFLLICQHFNWLQDYAFMPYLVTTVKYCVGGLVLLAGLEFFANKNWFFLILYLLIAAAAVLFFFAPGVIDKVVNLFRK